MIENVIKYICFSVVSITLAARYEEFHYKDMTSDLNNGNSYTGKAIFLY